MSTAILPRLALRDPTSSTPNSANLAFADPASASDVAATLLGYLCYRLSLISPRYSVPPIVIPNGWETYTYRFRLQAAADVPADWQRPLILRVYSSPHGLPRLRREFAAQEYLHRAGYPVAVPLLLEENCDLFGGPFLIMAHVAGELLPDYLYRRPWRIWDLPAEMAECQARLHRLPIDGFPVPERPFLDRRLEEIQSLIDAYGLDGLTPGYAWLLAHRPKCSHAPTIVHLDFHPLNLICGDGGLMTVLDWTEVDVGDPHADVASTRMLMDCVPLEQPTLLQKTAYWIGRGMLRRRYLRAYRRIIPLDRRTLAYYRAWAALRRLCCYGRWLEAGPGSTGAKPSSVNNLSPALFDTLGRYFERWTGVAVQLHATTGALEVVSQPARAPVQSSR